MRKVYFHVDRWSWAIRAVEVIGRYEDGKVGITPWDGGVPSPVRAGTVFDTLDEAKDAMRGWLIEQSDKLDRIQWCQDIEKMIENTDRRTVSGKRALRERREF